jgi:hypothetical protein
MLEVLSSMQYDLRGPCFASVRCCMNGSACSVLQTNFIFQQSRCRVMRDVHYEGRNHVIGGKAVSATSSPKMST